MHQMTAKKKCGMYLSITFRTDNAKNTLQRYGVGVGAGVGVGVSAGAATAFFPYFLLNRSTRPAESTSFCFPVKNG
jgi:hypothetical protein